MIKFSKLVHTVALKNNMDDATVKYILESPFDFMKDVAIPEKKNFRFPYLGAFYINENSKRYKKYVQRIKRDIPGVEELHNE